MRRLYCTFAYGAPGLGLLLTRLVVGGNADAYGLLLLNSGLSSKSLPGPLLATKGEPVRIAPRITVAAMRGCGLGKRDARQEAARIFPPIKELARVALFLASKLSVSFNGRRYSADELNGRLVTI